MPALSARPAAPEARSRAPAAIQSAARLAAVVQVGGGGCSTGGCNGCSIGGVGCGACSTGGVVAVVAATAAAPARPAGLATPGPDWRSMPGSCCHSRKPSPPKLGARIAARFACAVPPRLPAPARRDAARWILRPATRSCGAAGHAAGERRRTRPGASKWPRWWPS